MKPMVWSHLEWPPSFSFTGLQEYQNLYRHSVGKWHKADKYFTVVDCQLVIMVLFQANKIKLKENTISTLSKINSWTVPHGMLHHVICARCLAFDLHIIHMNVHWQHEHIHVLRQFEVQSAECEQNPKLCMSVSLSLSQSLSLLSLLVLLSLSQRGMTSKKSCKSTANMDCLSIYSVQNI